MHEDAANFVFDFIVCPIGMLAPQESRFVPAHGPVELMRRIPALRRGHPPKDFDLLGTGLFVGKHCSEF